MAANIFLKDGRLHPFWRALIYSLAVPSLGVALWAIYEAATGHLQYAFTLSDEIAAELTTALAALLVALWLRRYVDRRSIASLGFAPSGPWLRLFGLGILFGAGMQTIAYLLEVAFGYARITGVGGFASDVRLVFAAALVFLAAAFLEELSFRGYLFQNFWEAWGVKPAIIFTSILFALLHITNPHAREQMLLTLAGLLAFAAWASMSLLWTRSLWLAFGAHAAWNLFEGPVFGLPVSGVALPVHSVFTQSVTGPGWFTGSRFGPEAGVSSLVALFVGLVALRLLFAKGTFRGVADTCETYARE